LNQESSATTGQLTDLKSLTRPQLQLLLTTRGMTAYHARQLFRALYCDGVSSIAEVHAITARHRDRLRDRCTISRLPQLNVRVSDDGTMKYLFQLHDGETIESVLIPRGDRRTLCVSSQVGCRMGCRFCVTARMGFKRNLTVDEIVNQVVEVSQQAKTTLTNIVFMGMGEALDNLPAVENAIRILTDESGFNFSRRRITISTIGIIPRLAEVVETLGINLTISLHTADDRLRSDLMPMNQKYPLDQIIAACRSIRFAPRQRLIVAITLLRGVNDHPDDARRLIDKIRGLPVKVNLIPFNSFAEAPFEEPTDLAVQAYAQPFYEAGYTITIRRRRGGDIAAACGLLAAGHFLRPLPYRARCGSGIG